MAGAMRLVAPTTTASHEVIGPRLRNGGELGSSSSSSSDSIRTVLRGWWSGGLTDRNDRRCFAAHGFFREGRISAGERRNYNGIGGGGSRGGGFSERERREQYRNRIVMRAGGDKNGGNLGDDQVETLFMRELRRRGMSSKEKNGAPETDTETKEESEGGGSFFRGWARTKPSPELTQSQRDEQLKRSMALNSEGLEGLIPRGTELLKLGSTFFVAFWPFIIANLVAFGAVYLYFGSAFIHTGSSFEETGRPPYVDPYQILEEPLPPQMGRTRVPYNAKADDTRTDSNSP